MFCSERFDIFSVGANPQVIIPFCSIPFLLFWAKEKLTWLLLVSVLADAHTVGRTDRAFSCVTPLGSLKTPWAEWSDIEKNQVY